MNKLLKSLLTQAHLDVMENLGEIETNIVAERFAKLIVLECINTLQNNYAPDDCLPQEEIAGCLKERFGL